MVLNSQSFLPVAASTPKILPCAANSPAVEPKVSTSPATTGGEVKLQPWQLAKSVSWTCHFSLPVFWSRAMPRPSTVPMKTMPWPTATPRL